MGPYYWLGGAPGEPLDSSTHDPNYRRSLPTKRVCCGRAENHFDVPDSAFVARNTLGEILEGLFGDLSPTIVESVE